MKVIEIKLLIPYKEEFSLPAFTGLIEGYMEVQILRASHTVLEVKQAHHSAVSETSPLPLAWGDAWGEVRAELGPMAKHS